MPKFKINSKYKPAGDQPQAIEKLISGLNSGFNDQILLGVTGSGKTFTMANIIERTQRTALIMAHNKTLAAQLYAEMTEFFPENEIGYFVSFYDYYQPEAYIPRTDTYIEKDSTINQQIDRLRHNATRALFERQDTIVVASVSCIYGIGSPEFYSSMVMRLRKGDSMPRQQLLNRLVDLQYTRNDLTLERNQFRVSGDVIDVFPPHYEDRAYRISMFGNEIEELSEFDPLTGHTELTQNELAIYPSSHYVTPKDVLSRAISQIKVDLRDRVDELEQQNKLVEAQRLEQKTRYDMEMILATGSCKGIENYSRYLTGRAPSSSPPTLFEYLPKNALLFVDESHISVPQIDGMYKGDLARKSVLVEHGFRMASALDNRPLKFKEWEEYRPQTIYVSATPGKYENAKIAELNTNGGAVIGVAEQIIRPTGLIDPVCIIRPAKTQVDDLINEVKTTKTRGFRSLVTTLTKKMAERLTEYLAEVGISVVYMHSDVDTLKRVEIIQDLRRGTYDCLVGVNLLREGLDMPEVALVAILDADKEGFLRNETSLIQTIGRAARNTEGYVILYADKETKSITRALAETERRRTIQIAHNQKHGITPQTIIKPIESALDKLYGRKPTENLDLNYEELAHQLSLGNEAVVNKKIAALEKQMKAKAADLQFEDAARIRNEIKLLQELKLKVI